MPSMFYYHLVLILTSELFLKIPSLGAGDGTRTVDAAKQDPLSYSPTLKGFGVLRQRLTM